VGDGTGMGIQETAAKPPDAGEDGTAQGRIPFLLRIGVTGHRKLPEGKELLKAVIKAVNDAIDLAISRSRYPGAGRHTPKLVAVSALAEGADRLVAWEVLNRNGGLVCVLPVAEKDLDLYRSDFESEKSRQEFDDLRGRAQRQIEPPENLPPQERDVGYLWAQQAVARNSDVIIAIWDGQRRRGVGGTADLIRRLRDRDTEKRTERPPEEPVLEETGPLRIIVHVGDGHSPYVYVDEDPPYDVAAAAAQDRLRRERAGLEAFNHRDFKDWQRWTQRTMDELAPAYYRQWPRLYNLLTQIAPPLTRADQEAIAAQRAFRWFAYALFGFTALATILAALQAIVLTGTWELTLGELALIIAAVAIVYWERGWKNNNKHWYVYRFLAERLRTTFYLLAVGRVPDTDFDVGGTTQDPTRNDWVRRALIAILAQADSGKSGTPEDPETLSSLIRVHWMGGQLRYFERTGKKMTRRHHTLIGLLYGVLGATIVAALLHSLRIWPFHSDETEALIMCAIGLPAVAGALSNIRGLREFSRHAFRYTRMAVVMRSYLEQIGEESSIDDLGVMAEKVGNLLTAETRGWLVEVSGHGLEMHV
jgi:hypothetical protein